MADASRVPRNDYDNAQAVAASQKGKATEGGCAECHEGNWIHVRYEYPSDQPVTDAVYIVQKPNGGEPGGEVITEGVLTVTQQSTYEFIHVDLGDYNGEVEVYFFDDPTEPETAEDPGKVEDERGFFSRAADGVLGAAKWTGGIVLGDFNEDMSTGQIITNAVVTAVPVVDQVADIRDLVANGKALIWDKRFNEIAVWVGVFACLIGLVPGLGSLAKGVIKLVWRNAGEVGRILIYINKALFKVGRPMNGYRFVKRLADEIPGQVAFVTQKFNEFLDVMVEKTTLAQRLIPSQVADTLATIETLRGMANEKFAEAAAEIRVRILRGLSRFAGDVYHVSPHMSIAIRRAVEVITDAGPFKSWQSGMNRIMGDSINDLEVGARKIDDEALEFFSTINMRAQKWQKELLADPNLPPSLKEAVKNKKFLNTLATFGEKPRYIDYTKQGPSEIYRVVDEPEKFGGGYWSRSRPPETEAEWRARDAVLNEWNRGGAYFVAEVPPPDAAFVGPIAPQNLADRRNTPPKPGMMLEGGGEQIWFPPPVSQSAVKEIWFTPWNAPSRATRAIRKAGKIGECDL